ncbi:MAG: N-acetylneuraminate synthase family protein [Candidatus Omnitrophota bacterium]
MAEFVAEVSSNHHGSLERCERFIETAKDIGCDSVKFQLFRIEELFSPEILAKSERHRQRKAWELPLEFIPGLAAKCRDLDIKFSCTPFYLAAVDQLRPYADFLKVASYELLWTDLIRSCGATGLPVVLSTGMATMPEIERAVDALLAAGSKDMTLLHCVSGYPVPADQCNLSAIGTMRNELSKKHPDARIKFGWSDHSVNPGVIYRAINHWGAGMVEFHLDLDGTGDEYKTGHCWLPGEIGEVIRNVKRGILFQGDERADGKGKKEPVGQEMIEREWRADPEDGLRPLKKTRKTF